MRQLPRRHRTTAACTLAATLLLSLPGAAAEARLNRGANRTRRLIVNDDGEVGPLHDGRSLTDYLSARFADVPGTHVDSYFLCVGSTDRGPGSGVVPRVQDTQNRWFPSRKPLPEIDVLTRAYIDAAREADIELFASFRMNDIHDAWAPKLTYPLKVERPDLLIGAKEQLPYPTDSLMRGFWSGLDYAKAEVRQHFRDFILSYCETYDFDGVELDFFRHPLFFKVGAESENLATMTGFVREIRQGLDRIGAARNRPYLLTARVPDTPEIALQTGLDVEAWLRQGLLDLLMVGGGYMPYAARIREFIDMAHRYGVLAYPCINHFQAPLQMRTWASNYWALGADGIYLFNYFGVEDGSEKATCLNQLGDPEKLLGLDKHCEPDNGLCVFYCSYTNPAGPFPGDGFQGAERRVKPVRLVHGTPLEIVVGDDLEAAAARGLTPTAQLDIHLANHDPKGGITLQINGVQLPADEVARLAPDTFTAAVPAQLLRRGVNTVTVLPGPGSAARLAAQVTGMSLAVTYNAN